jgi:hypothetical protein
MRRNLLWDRTLPKGPGMKYWEVVEEKDLLVRQILEIAERHGSAARSYDRSAVVDRPDQHVINWATYRDERGEVVSFGDPYGQ